MLFKLSTLSINTFVVALLSMVIAPSMVATAAQVLTVSLPLRLATATPPVTSAVICILLYEARRTLDKSIFVDCEIIIVGNFLDGCDFIGSDANAYAAAVT